MHKFFLVVLPGFEDVAFAELKSISADIKNPEVLKGGIEFQAKLETGFALNSVLRIPTRILLRMEERNCKSFDEFKVFINELPLGKFLSSLKIKMKVSSYRSKLYHKMQIEDIAKRTIKKKLKELNIKKTPDEFEHEVYVRIEHNYVNISLDTSGDALFKRGYKSLSGVAPLRENIAAACLQYMLSLTDKKSIRLLDPMCGTGTFLLEAASWPETFPRDYAFRHFPAFKKMKLDKFNIDSPYEFQLEGWDRSETSIAWVQESFKNLDADLPELQQQDYFNPKTIKTNYDIVMFNPPYGERIKLPMPAKKYWPQVYEQLEKMKVPFAGLIVPRSSVSLMPKPSHQLPFSNGGVDVVFMVYKFS